MIEARHTKIGILFFNLYSHIRLHRHFKNISIQGNSSLIDDTKSLLVLGNHFSWWDGFIQLLLNNKLFRRRFHVMMLEEQLKKNMILNKCGAFSIKKNNRSVFQSLNYTTQLLSNARNMVVMFPQGEIQSVYTSYFKFERGLQYLLKQIDNNVQIVFNVNLIDYFSDNTPSLYIYYTIYSLDADTSVETLEKAFNEFASSCIKQQLPRSLS